MASATKSADRLCRAAAVWHDREIDLSLYHDDLGLDPGELLMVGGDIIPAH